MKTLENVHERLITNTNLDFKRYLYHEIDFNSRLIIISGCRGVGKTTLLLQYLKEESEPRSMYLSLDNLYFTQNTLLKTVDQFYVAGIRTFALDEVHKYENWSIEIKNIYDSYPNIKLLITASSALDIMKGSADLSRRADLYRLKGLSFREYLGYEHNLEFSILSLDALVNNHVELSVAISQKIPVLRYFKAYLQKGYYPFYKESKTRYHDKVASIINQVIETDLPPIFNIDYSTVRQLKKLLAIIAQIAPFSPNVADLSRNLQIPRNRILLFIDYLERADIINTLKASNKSDSALTKPDKIFLENPNIIHALASEEVNTGTERETFFMNAVGSKNKLTTPAKGDFMVNSTYVFEIGGPNKSRTQITGIPNAYLAKDKIEVGYSGVIPLWLFGFFY